jgi:hypothetical protein
VFGGDDGCFMFGEGPSNFTITPDSGFSNTPLTVTFVSNSVNIFEFFITQGIGQSVTISYDTFSPTQGISLSLNIPGAGPMMGSIDETVCTQGGSGFSSFCASPLFDLSVNNLIVPPVTTIGGGAGFNNDGSDFVSETIVQTGQTLQGIVPETNTLCGIGTGLLVLVLFRRIASRHQLPAAPPESSISTAPLRVVGR